MRVGPIESVLYANELSKHGRALAVTTAPGLQVQCLLHPLLKSIYSTNHVVPCVGRHP